MAVDLAKFLDGPLVNAIYEAYEKRRASEKPRRYLGASIIGKECKRAVWYDFRWTTPVAFSGRMLRLFDTGNHEEARFVKDLRDIGCTVYAFDPTTGKQFEFDDHHGHMAGHMDACGEKIPEGGKAWHVLEFKTHSSKSFAELRKKGVKESKPEHYAQMMMYMGWSGMERALYLAKDKDTDELYAERVRFDQGEFDRLRARAASIIFDAGMPLRISDDPAHWQCKMCNHYELCHGQRGAQKNCRTCIYATPTKDGNATWVCERSEYAPIAFERQLTGCGDHLHMPPLLAYAEPLEAGDSWIVYRHKTTGRNFVVVTETGMPPTSLSTRYGLTLPFYTSDEIAAAHAFNITNADVDELRSAFDGKIVGSTCQHPST